jgi:antagonist of KipI
MSLKITKTGILDTIQDLGRTGYQYMGVNPGGAMDRYAARLCNIVIGNEQTHPVIELHFPASGFLFNKPALIAMAGADFDPIINDKPVPLYQPIIVNKNARLQFGKKRKGARCYLAIKGLEVTSWLNSASTNLKASAGGNQGRALRKGDLLEFNDFDYGASVSGSEFILLPWKADLKINGDGKNIDLLPGNEWNLLDEANKAKFMQAEFTISVTADRMGYQLEGPGIFLPKNEELVSSGICFGTVQLLPNGQLIILMADHQTTGGYPRLGHIPTAQLSEVAQMNPGETLKFIMVNIKAAEDLLVQQDQHLLQLQNACKFRLTEFFG